MCPGFQRVPREEPYSKIHQPFCNMMMNSFRIVFAMPVIWRLIFRTSSRRWDEPSSTRISSIPFTFSGDTPKILLS